MAREWGEGEFGKVPLGTSLLGGVLPTQLSEVASYVDILQLSS